MEGLKKTDSKDIKETPKFLSILLDKNTKNEFDNLCKSNGLNFSYAINRFINRCLKEQKIPFHSDQIKLYNQNENQELIRCSIRINSQKREEFKKLCKVENYKMNIIIKVFILLTIQEKKFVFFN